MKDPTKYLTDDVLLSNTFQNQVGLICFFITTIYHQVAKRSHNDQLLGLGNIAEIVLEKLLLQFRINTLVGNEPTFWQHGKQTLDSKSPLSF